MQTTDSWVSPLLWSVIYKIIPLTILFIVYLFFRVYFAMFYIVDSLYGMTKTDCITIFIQMTEGSFTYRLSPKVILLLLSTCSVYTNVLW